MDVDASQVGALDFNIIAGDTFGFYAANPDNSSITIGANGEVAAASSTAIVDTDASNDGPPLFLGAEKLIGTFYVNPIDAAATSVDITINSMLVVTDVAGINIVQDDYTYTAADIV